MNSPTPKWDPIGLDPQPYSRKAKSAAVRLVAQDGGHMLGPPHPAAAGQGCRAAGAARSDCVAPQTGLSGPPVSCFEVGQKG